MAHVDDAEVLLLWRALSQFRSGARPACRPRGTGRHSDCPLFSCCPRWTDADDDRRASLEETFDDTERRRASWPCSRLLDLLGPDTRRIGR